MKSLLNYKPIFSLFPIILVILEFCEERKENMHVYRHISCSFHEQMLFAFVCLLPFGRFTAPTYTMEMIAQTVPPAVFSNTLPCDIYRGEIGRGK